MKIEFWPAEQREGYLKRVASKHRQTRKVESIKERIISFRDANVSVCAITSAYVYVIENSAFPGWYKVGTCVDLEKRLQSYQTSDPMRGYVVKDYWVTRNRQDVESEVLSFAERSSSFEVKGEWVKPIDYKKLRGKIVSLCTSPKRLEKHKKITAGMKDK